MKESLQLRFWNLNSTSNSPVAPRRLSCQISTNQREAETSANVNKHWKTRGKGNDVIINVIFARYSTSSDVVVSSPSSSRAPRRVCSQARKTLLLKSTSINIFVLLMLRPTFHATPEKICAPGLNEALRAEFLRFRNNTVLQNSKRSKTFKRMCVLRDVVTLSPSSSYFRSMWVPRPSLGQSKKAVGGTKTSFSRYEFIETFGENRCFTILLSTSESRGCSDNASGDDGPSRPKPASSFCQRYQIDPKMLGTCT